MCSYCNEEFGGGQVKKHERLCKKLSQFIENLPDGYQCLVCSMTTTKSKLDNSNSRTKARREMYRHIKTNHLNEKVKKSHGLIQNMEMGSKKQLAHSMFLEW